MADLMILNGTSWVLTLIASRLRALTHRKRAVVNLGAHPSYRGAHDILRPAFRDSKASL